MNEDYTYKTYGKLMTAEVDNIAVAARLWMINNSPDGTSTSISTEKLISYIKDIPYYSVNPGDPNLPADPHFSRSAYADYRVLPGSLPNEYIVNVQGSPLAVDHAYKLLLKQNMRCAVSTSAWNPTVFPVWTFDYTCKH